MTKARRMVRDHWAELLIGTLFVGAIGFQLDPAFAAGRGSDMLSGSFDLAGSSPKTNLYGVVPPGGYTLELYANSEPGKFLGVIGKPDIGQTIAGTLLWIVNFIWLLGRMLVDLAQMLLELGFRTDLAGAGAADTTSVMAKIYGHPIVKGVWGLGILYLVGKFLFALAKGSTATVIRQVGIALFALIIASALLVDRGRAMREASDAVSSAKNEVLGISKVILPPPPSSQPGVKVDGLGAAQDAIAYISYLQPWMVMQTGGIRHCAVVLNEDAFDGDTKPPGGWPAKFDDPDEEVKRVGLAWPCADRGKLVKPSTRFAQVKSDVTVRVSKPINHRKYVRDLLYNEDPARQGAAIAIRDGLTKDQAAKMEGEQYGVEREDLRVRTSQNYGPADMPAADPMFVDEMVLHRGIYAVITDISQIPLLLIVLLVALGAAISGVIALGCLLVTPVALAAAPWGDAGSGVFRQWAQTFAKAMVASAYYALMFIVALALVAAVNAVAYSANSTWPPLASQVASSVAWLGGLYVMRKLFRKTPGNISGKDSLNKGREWARRHELYGKLDDLRDSKSKGGKGKGDTKDSNEDGPSASEKTTHDAAAPNPGFSPAGKKGSRPDGGGESADDGKDFAGPAPGVFDAARLDEDEDDAGPTPDRGPESGDAEPGGGLGDSEGDGEDPDGEAAAAAGRVDSGDLEGADARGDLADDIDGGTPPSGGGDAQDGFPEPASAPLAALNGDDDESIFDDELSPSDADSGGDAARGDVSLPALAGAAAPSPTAPTANGSTTPPASAHERNDAPAPSPAPDRSNGNGGARNGGSAPRAERPDMEPRPLKPSPAAPQAPSPETAAREPKPEPAESGAADLRRPIGPGADSDDFFG